MKKESILFGFLIIFLCISNIGCEKDEEEEQTETDFIITSSVIGSDGLLPQTYTCDGESSTVPLEWTGAPNGTVSFALLMDHEAGADDFHWYWIVYNIPSSTNSLAENFTNIGVLGNNSVNEMCQYSPPCSKGPGEKEYTFTLYALSKELDVPSDPTEVDRDYLLNAIEGNVISSTSITVIYSRDI